jgi:hypothetical protein
MDSRLAIRLDEPINTGRKILMFIGHVEVWHVGYDRDGVKLFRLMRGR